MPAAIDLTGERYGRLVVLGLAPARGVRKFWLCQCDCGSSAVEVWHGSLRNGVTKSCGCLRRETARAAVTTHGMRDTPEYAVWCTMKARCSNPNDAHFKDYGGRGISVCQRWIDSFEAFIADMGRRPSSEHSIERENNGGNYEPGNCVWATREQQMRNRRPWGVGQAHVDGELVSAADSARRLGTSQTTIAERIKRGWDPVRAATQPVRRRRVNGDEHG